MPLPTLIGMWMAGIVLVAGSLELWDVMGKPTIMTHGFLFHDLRTLEYLKKRKYLDRRSDAEAAFLERDRTPLLAGSAVMWITFLFFLFCYYYFE